MPDFSLVIPIYNESSVLPELVRRSVSALEALDISFEIIFVDDGSSDDSWEQLLRYRGQDKRIKILSLSRNFGHQAAIFAGIAHARGELTGIIDGDLQDPPEILGDFIRKIHEGYDVVYAVRKTRKEGIVKKLIYKAYYRILKKMSNIYIPMDSGDFCVMRRMVAEYIVSRPEQSLFIRGIRSWLGFRQIGFEYDRDKRFAGEPKYTFRKLMLLAFNGIFSFSRFPVKFISVLGMLVIFFSLIYIAITLVKKYYFGDVPQGFTTLIIFISLFSGVQLLSLGLIGEYIHRIYDETRQRPIYIIREKKLDD